MAKLQTCNNAVVEIVWIIAKILLARFCFVATLKGRAVAQVCGAEADGDARAIICTHLACVQPARVQIRETLAQIRIVTRQGTEFI